MQTQTSNTLHNAIIEAGGKDRPPMLAPDKEVPIIEGSSVTTTETYMENYKNVSQDIRDQLNAEAKGKSINVQDLETNLYWKFGKFTPRDGESLESYYSRFYKMINELVRNQYDVTNHQMNVQFLLQLQQEWQRFVTLVKQSQELKTVSYHKLYDILKQHQNKVNELRAERIAHAANPLALVAQKQPVYHPHNHPTHYTQNSSTRSQQAATRIRGKAIVNPSSHIYDQEPSMIAEDDEMSKDKEIDKLMALISLSFKKIYKPTNNNLRTSSNTSRANQDNSLRINRGTGYEHQRIGNVASVRETVGTTVQADWRDDTDDESEDQELEAHYMYMAQIQEVSSDAANSRPIFDSEPVQKVSNDDHYNVFAIESEHPEQSKSVHDTYPIEQDEHNVIIDSLDMSYDREQIDQNDDDDLANERELLASLIKKLKCEIDDRKNHNKFLETSNKVLVEQLKGEIDDFKTQNKSLESSNNRFKEANNKLLETNKLMYTDLKKFKAELDRRNDVEYASKMQIDCAKAKGDLISYKMESQKSFNKYTQQINDLNQTISEMKKKLSAHQETISILSQAKEAQIKLYKTREDKELDKFIALENKVKVLDNIVYKTGQSVQTMNMLNSKCKTSFAKPEFLKKAQRANHRLYDIGCYNDNLALMLAPESDKVIRLEKESRSKLSDLIRPFDYDKLNNLYDLFVPQREKSAEQIYFSERSRMSHTPVNNGNSKESFNKQTTLLEKRMDKSIPWDQKCKSSKEFFKIKRSVGTIFDGVEHEVTNLQCDYLELLEKCKCLEKELLNSKMMSKSFKALQKHAINLELDLQQCQERIKNDKSFKENQSKEFCKEREQYFKIQDLKAQLQDKGIAIRVIPTTSVSRPELKSNPMEDRVMLTNSQGKKQEVEDQHRNVKFSKNKTSVTACNDSLNAKTSNVKFVCATCGKCVLNDKHDMCVLKSLDGVNSRTTIPIVVPLIEIVLFIVDSGCSKHMTGNLKLLINFVEKFLGTVKFENDQIAPILGYGDLSTSYIRDLKRNDILTGYHGTDLYSITLQDTTSTNPICLMAKATSSQVWLWHRRLSHLNFDTINLLLKHDIVVGLPKLKFVKAHMCSSCELGKAKQKTFQTKTTPSSKRRL
nr:hypothetical protein [Tanacetum cinerariifolium]